MSDAERKSVAAESATIKLKTAYGLGVAVVGALWVVASGWYGVQAKLTDISNGQLTIAQKQLETHDWIAHISQKQDDLQIEISEHERQLDKIQASLDNADVQAEAAARRDKKYQAEHD